VKKVIIFGFGGHARSVADIALANGYTDIIFYEQNAQPDEKFLGFDVVNRLPDDLDVNKWHAFPASGDACSRAKQIKIIDESGFSSTTLIAPTATIGVGAVIGRATLIGQHAHIGPKAIVGVGCIINTSAVLEHESKVGNYTHISVGANVAGRCDIGSYCFICVGSTVIDKVKVADNVVLGAGACAIRDLSVSGVYVGVPARLVDL
jgi:UDP-N-acetylbacillosamine N-acetyltransferase